MTNILATLNLVGAIEVIDAYKQNGELVSLVIRGKYRSCKLIPNNPHTGSWTRCTFGEHTKNGNRYHWEPSLQVAVTSAIKYGNRKYRS